MKGKLSFILFVFLPCIIGTCFAADRSLNLNLKPGLGLPLDGVIGSIVSADGSGLPKGEGTVAKGKVVYRERCAVCHGGDAKLSANPLVGGVGSLVSNRPQKTIGSFWPYATTLFDYIARAMPYNEEKSLSADEVYSVTAYLLNLNKIIADDVIISSKNLAQVAMPNRDGFIELLN